MTERIKDIQKIVIQSLHERGFKYEDLALVILEKVPNVDTLTRSEAAKIVRYGRSLYEAGK